MNLTVLKAIRLKCLECCCGSRTEVSNCLFTSCPLWPYRMGRKPTEQEAGQYSGNGVPLLKSKVRSEIGRRMSVKLAEFRRNSSSD